MTPKHLMTVVEILADVRDDINRMSRDLDRLIDYLYDTSCAETQLEKAAKNREDSIDELLKKEGLYW